MSVAQLPGIHITDRNEEAGAEKAEQPPPENGRVRDADAGVHLRQRGLGEHGSSYDFSGHALGVDGPQGTLNHSMAIPVCHRILIMVNIF